MANTLPGYEVAASIAVHANEARTDMISADSPDALPGGLRAYLPLFVRSVLSSPNQYQLLSSELALFKMAPP